MNFMLFITIGLFSLAAAAVVPGQAGTGGAETITFYENNNDGDGNYNFSYKTSNGITRDETGYLVNVGQDNEHMVVRGSYSYTDTDGVLVVVNYTADENGFHISPPQKPQFLPPNVVASLLGK